jgi:hypothetical protein
MNKTDRIYPRLTPGAAARVAWALMSTDPVEAERVVATVHRELRLAPGQEFGYVVAWLQAVSSTWGVAHWRLMTERSNACAALAISKSDAAMLTAATAVRAIEGRLLACDVALDDAALNAGFDAQVVRDFAQAERYTPIHPLAVCDDDYAAMLHTAFLPPGKGLAC